MLAVFIRFHFIKIHVDYDDLVGLSMINWVFLNACVCVCVTTGRRSKHHSVRLRLRLSKV